MSTTISPNMLLTVPVVGVEPGPDWASDINNCFDILDQHDHSSGSGVLITPAGLNINAALNMQGNELDNTAAVVMTAQTSFSTNKSLYVIGNEVYYRDGAGNQVQITNGGNVNAGAGSITGLPSGSASVVYTSGNQTYTFQSATSTAANLDAGALLMRNLSPNSTYALTLTPPAALGSNYTLTLPALPASKKIATVTAAGVVAADYDTDNVTLEVSGTSLRVKDAGISHAKMGPLGQQLSTAANFSTSSLTYVSVTNLSVTITTYGNPVMLMLIADNATPSTQGFIQVSSSTASNTARVRMVRDPSGFTQNICTQTLGGSTTPSITAQGVGSISSQGTNNGSGSPVANVGITAGANSSITAGVSSTSVIYPNLISYDTPSAGTYTYVVQALVGVGTTTISFSNMSLTAFEMR